MADWGNDESNKKEVPTCLSRRVDTSFLISGEGGIRTHVAENRQTDFESVSL